MSPLLKALLASAILIISFAGCSRNTTEPVTTPIEVSTPIPMVAITAVTLDPVEVTEVPVAMPDPVVVEMITEEPIVVQDPIEDELPIEPVIYTAVFTGRIIYESGLPVTGNLIIAVGDDWNSFAYTDSNGAFSIEVIGDTRFIFSALSPFTAETSYCSYISSLMVEESTTSEGFDCNITTPIDICIENSINYP